MATTAPKFTYRCNSINEAGAGTVSVSFVREVEDGAEGPAFSGGSFTLTLTSEDAMAYFPGQVYTLTLTKKAAS